MQTSMQNPSFLELDVSPQRQAKSQSKSSNNKKWIAGGVIAFVILALSMRSTGTNQHNWWWTKNVSIIVGGQMQCEATVGSGFIADHTDGCSDAGVRPMSLDAGNRFWIKGNDAGSITFDERWEVGHVWNYNEVELGSTKAVTYPVTATVCFKDKDIVEEGTSLDDETFDSCADYTWNEDAFIDNGIVNTYGRGVHVDVWAIVGAEKPNPFVQFMDNAQYDAAAEDNRAAAAAAAAPAGSTTSGAPMESTPSPSPTESA